MLAEQHGTGYPYYQVNRPTHNTTNTYVQIKSRLYNFVYILDNNEIILEQLTSTYTNTFN